ncbi:phage tail domain-containing protein [Sporosarcina sp. FSL K6-1522]|uniref:phage tail domain-containing protein n=1 Tax=Sporosarcina sp. FSL K6-1522 TaxID=2921554 RepID=UPI003159FBCA
MSLIIEKLNGEYYQLDRYGIFEKERLVISSPDVEVYNESVEGLDGLVDFGAELRGREIKASLLMLADNLVDMPKMRDEIFRIFDSRELFYLSEERDPAKRWSVRCVSPFDISELATIGEFELNLLSPSPFSSSTILAKFISGKQSFVFRNTGTESIRMEAQNETEITFKGVSSGLTIKNLTTGDEWKYNGSTTTNDEIMLKGVRSLKNGQSIFGQTNKRLISFAPGQNEMKIEGATDFEITIRTRFYFL